MQGITIENFWKGGKNMLFNTSIDLFMNYISSYCSEDTIYYYSINLDMFSKFICTVKGNSFNISELTKNDFIGYIAFLRSKTVKNTSIRTYARAIKVYLKYLYNEGYIVNDITKNVRFPRSDSRYICPLTNDDVLTILSGINGRCKARNVLIFYLMLECGLRLQEVVNLNVNDIDFDNNIIKINNSKYNKSRFVPLPVNVNNAIVGYLSVRNDDNNALILDIHNKDRITKVAIKKMFNRWKFKYNIELYPHLLRHTFATSFIMGGGNIEILRILLGHSDFNVTKNYIHLANQYSLLNYDIYRLDKCVFNCYKVYDVST